MDGLTSSLLNAFGGQLPLYTNVPFDLPTQVIASEVKTLQALLSSQVMQKLSITNPADLTLVPFYAIGGTDVSGNPLGLFPAATATSPTIFADVPQTANLATDGNWIWNIPSTATDGSTSIMLKVQLRAMAVGIAGFMLKTPNVQSYVESITFLDPSNNPREQVFLDEPVYMPNYPYEFVMLPFPIIAATNDILNIAFTFRGNAAGQSVEIVPVPQVALISKNNAKYLRMPEIFNTVFPSQFAALKSLGVPGA